MNEEQHMRLHELAGKRKNREFRDQWISAMIEAINDGARPGFLYENSIICPWCGAEYNADVESEYYATEGNHNETCYKCKKEFAIDTDISITYST